MGKILTTGLLLPVVLLAVVACSNDTCRKSTSAAPRATFYSSQEQTRVTLDSITIYGVGVPGDSAVMRNATATQAALPLRINAAQCQFVLHYEAQALRDPRLNDTLTIDYEPQAHFVSTECGAMFYYAISAISCTDHLIDSVNIAAGEVTNVAQENIRIYFRTSQPEE